MKTKIFDIERGWGEVVFESDNYVVVRWDADPWVLEQIAKEEE